MWKYTCITRQRFEEIKDKTEQYILSLGGNKAEVTVPYRPTAPNDGTARPRPLFAYGGQYYRVGQVLFPDKPFIVIECGSYDEAMNNVMEDIEPFPYDLSEDALFNEVKYALGIEPYPRNY